MKSNQQIPAKLNKIHGAILRIKTQQKSLRLNVTLNCDWKCTTNNYYTSKLVHRSTFAHTIHFAHRNNRA